MSSSKTLKYWLIALLVPMLCWAFLYKIWIGRFFLGFDNTDFFYWLIYHFKNVLTGVYPLWNPFKAWGCLDYIDTQALGVSNPLSLIIPILLLFGVKAYWAYASYVIIFWMSGFFGFFFLLYRIYNDPRIAWAASSLLMFTGGLAVNFTWTILILYIFCPLGWFLGFLVGFVRSDNDLNIKKNLLGLAFSCMFIAHLYLPFYILTLLLTFVTSTLLFARDWFIQFFSNCKRAIRCMPWVVLFCLISIFFAFAPSIDCYFKMKDPQNVTIFFRGDDEGVKGDSLNVSQQMINRGGLPSMGLFSEIFSSYETGDQYLSFMPLILFILALLTIFNKSSKIQRVVFMTGFLLLLITITNACPLQHFLYKYIYFFKLFRNYFFFWVLFWACCVVYVMGETKQFLEWDFVSDKKHFVYGAWIVVVHLVLIVYLMCLEDVPVINFVTIIASCFWFLGRLFEPLRQRKSLFIIGLIFIGLWQPFYVLPFLRSADQSKVEYQSPKISFSYERPLYGTGFNEQDARAGRLKYFRDESGFVNDGTFMGQKGAYLLQQYLSKEALSNYVRYKFILYDQTSLIDQQHIDWDKVRKVFTFQDSCALIWDQEGIVLNKVSNPSAPFIVKEPASDFKVDYFDVNSLEFHTNLSERKFLVYNDSYYSNWHVFIDGHPAKLYQANIDFKGVWLPKGSHLIKFFYGSWMDYLSGWGLALLFIVWFILIIVVFLPPKK